MLVMDFQPPEKKLLVQTSTVVILALHRYFLTVQVSKTYQPTNCTNYPHQILLNKFAITAVKSKVKSYLQTVVKRGLYAKLILRLPDSWLILAETSFYVFLICIVSLCSQCPWAEYLTSLPERGMGTLSSVSTFGHERVPMYVTVLGPSPQLKLTANYAPINSMPHLTPLGVRCAQLTIQSFLQGRHLFQ